MRTLLSRFRREEEGTAAVEMALLLPLFLTFVFSFYDIGALMLRQATLSSSVDLTARELKLEGTLLPGNSNPSAAQIMAAFRDRVCDRTYLLSDCTSELVIDMRPVPDAASFPALDAPCVQRGPGGPITPVTTFDQNASPEIMFIRVCAPSKSLFSGYGFGPAIQDANGDIMIRANTSFVYEG